MKALTLYAVAAALIAAPIGWIIAGFLSALSFAPRSRYSALYDNSEHAAAAFAAALLAFLAAFSIGIARRYKLRGDGNSARYTSAK